MRRAKTEDELHELRLLVDQAARGDDPAPRRKMAEEAIRLLEADAPLPPPVRLWLLFVLRRLLQQKDGIPKFARQRGRRGDDTTALLRNGELYHFLNEGIDKQYGKPINVVLDEAGRALGNWARKHWYSEDFAGFRLSIKLARRWRRRRDQAKRAKNSR